MPMCERGFGEGAAPVTFSIEHQSGMEVHAIHGPSKFVFRFAVRDGALESAPALDAVPPGMKMYESDARRAAIAWLDQRRREAEAAD
jgi:hypothetical protein